MKFSIDRERFIQSLNDSLRAVASKTPMPILTSLKLELTYNGLKIVGSNSDISIESFIPAEEAGDEIIEVEKVGAICLNARLLSEIIRKLPKDTVSVEAQDNFQTVIKSGKSEFKINGMDADEYPRLPDIDQNNSNTMDADLLKMLIRQTVYAVSHSENRPILTGVYWQVKDENLICAATDSHRLSRKQIPFISAEAINAVIPGKSLDELNKLIGDSTEQIEICFTANQVLFKLKNILFYSRLLEGNYPDIDKLIPPDETTTIKLNTRDLLQAIDRASILAKETKTNTVKMISTNDSIEISSNTPEIGDVVEEVAIGEMDGEEIKISFNARFMIEALRTVEDDDVLIRFTGTMRPFVLSTEHDHSLIQLILPVRTV